MKTGLSFGKEEIRMNKFFSNNIGWKTASLIFALFLWVFVINTQNPQQPYDMRNKSIVLKGTDLLTERGYVIKNETELREQKVRVVVKGPRLQIEKIISNPELVEARVDITRYVNNIASGMDMVAPIVPVDITVPLGLNIVEQSPKTVEVIFEREKTVTKPVEYIIHGGSNTEYQTLTPKIVPEEIEIWGAESYMDDITTVSVDINVENFSEDILSYEIPIKIYNSEGEEITELKQSHKYAEVTLPIGKKKTVPLEMQFVGELPEGFVQTNAVVSPQSITIIGKPELVDSINSIKLEKISLDNIIQTSKINTRFILPQGIGYLDQIDNNAVVTIQVKEQSLYEYNLDLSKSQPYLINTSEGFVYEIMDQDVIVKVKAIAEELLKINPADVQVMLDVKGYEEGEYEISLDLHFPPNILIEEQPKVRVRVTAKVEEPEYIEDPVTVEE